MHYIVSCYIIDLMVTHGRYATYTSGCRCDDCRGAANRYQNEHRATHPARRAKDAINTRRNNQRKRLLLNSLKDAPCTDCKIKYPYYVMHFDHLGIEPKLFNIARASGVLKMKAEIAKCELVCANCHAERTHQRRLLNK